MDQNTNVVIIDEEIIQENLKNVDEGKPLTMPLAILDGIFKARYFSRAYQKTDRHKTIEREYYRKNKEKWKKQK